MSTVVIGGNASFAYSGALSLLEAVPGSFSVTISSTFSGPKAPAPSVAFQANFDRAGLLALRGLIDNEVT